MSKPGPARQGARLSSQMDGVKEMFGAGNRRFTQDVDTSYFFFSPKPGLVCDVYQYLIEHGDSIHSELRKICPQEDPVTWEMNNRVMRLEQSSKGKLVWRFSQGGRK